MQVIIPMTGYGSRFKAAGYKDIKPFIKVFNKPMIEWVISMYPTAEDILLIVRDTTYNDYKNEFYNLMTKTNANINIITIKENTWEKKGPVDDVLNCAQDSFIKKDCPIVINYCDFFCLFDSNEFNKKAISLNVDGAIPCYTGFHPHLIPNKNVYASCKTDNKNMLLEIKEKYSFEKDKTKALHSPGVYWFKDINTFIEYGKKLENNGPSINNEYYVSLVYNELVKDNKKVWVPDNVSHMCQWGTPEDLQEFELWMNELGGNK